MEPKATIVHVLPGQVAPDEYLKLVLAENKVGFGFAGQEASGKIAIENTRGILLNEINELQNAFKDRHLVMYFTNGGVIPDDVMPFTVTNGQADDKMVHHLATFYEGDFNQYAGKDGGHAGVYCVYDEIAAKIGQCYVDNGKDWTKTFAAMRGESFIRSLCNYFDSRGAFVILPPIGDPIAFGTNDIGAQYSWGSVTNHHGYSPPAAAEVSGLSFLRGKKTAAMSSTAPAAPITPTPAPEPKRPPSEGPVHIVRKEEEDIETKVVDGVTYTKMRPPSAIRGNKKANNAWLRCFNRGNLDAETQKLQFCWVEADLIPYAQRLVKSKDEIEKMYTEISKLKRPPNVTKAERVAEESRNHLVGKEDKPITTSTVRESVAEATAKNKAAADFLPILDNDQREKALSKMAAFTSKGKRLTALEIQKMEARWPTFSEDIGVEYEELMERPIDEVLELFDGNKIAACAYIEQRAEVFRLRTLLQANKIDYQKPAKVEKTKAPADKPKEATGGLSFLRGKSAA